MLGQDTQIPLFPLRAVLFPGMMLPLHIFEERYKLMIRACLSSGEPFGVVLAKNEQAVKPNNSSPILLEDMYNIGTTAQISAVEQLDDGRMNLITVGQDRFVIKNIQVSLDNFLIGQVDPYPIEEEDTQITNRLAQKLRPVVEQYINHLSDVSGEDLSGATLPSDPTALAFLAGTAIQGPLSEKQELLSTKSLNKLMVTTLTMLDREDQILSYMLKAYQAHQQIQRLPFVDYSLN